jgi:hypothetical protein
VGREAALFVLFGVWAVPAFPTQWVWLLPGKKALRLECFRSMIAHVVDGNSDCIKFLLL